MSGITVCCKIMHFTKFAGNSSIGTLLDPSIAMLQKHLKSFYSRKPVVEDDKLLISPSKKYINLAVIKHIPTHAINHLDDVDEFTKGTLHGGIDEIVASKEPITLHNLFSSTDRTSQVILVEGPAGIGKSTFAWEICQNWDNLETLKDGYDIVLLLKLRDKRVQEAKKLSELFHPDEEVGQSVVKEIGVGERVLLVLDGYDEYPPPHFYFNRLIEQIIAGERLPGASLLVTSRPIAREQFLRLQPQISKHVEILGFTSQDRIEFARSAFSSTSGDMLTQFLDYCSGNPTIMSMMYIPLNCAIITQVYIDCGDDNRLVPKTMTQLYTALCRSLIRRYMKQKGFRNKRIPDNFKDLPSEVLDPFSCLARIAFEKLKHNELVFSLPDNDDFDHMGFMNVSVEMYVQTGVHHSYNFLHLSIQEYLAAWHICQMGDNCKIRETIYLEHDYMYQLNIFEEETENMEGDYDDKIGIFEISFLQNVLVFIAIWISWLNTEGGPTIL